MDHEVTFTVAAVTLLTCRLIIKKKKDNTNRIVPTRTVNAHTDIQVSVEWSLEDRKRHLQWLEPFQCWFLMDVL